MLILPGLAVTTDGRWLFTQTMGRQWTDVTAGVHPVVHDEIEPDVESKAVVYVGLLSRKRFETRRRRTRPFY